MWPQHIVELKNVRFSSLHRLVLIKKNWQGFFTDLVQAIVISIGQVKLWSARQSLIIVVGTLKLNYNIDGTSEI
jgi:hypothetical protein